MLKLLLKEIDIVPSAFFDPEDYDKVLKLLGSGRLKVDRCVTSVRPLDQAQDALVELTGTGAKDLKILLDPTL